MAGRPRGSEPRDLVLRVRITKAGKAAADQARGGISMSDYIRGLIAADVKRKGLR